MEPWEKDLRLPPMAKAQGPMAKAQRLMAAVWVAEAEGRAEGVVAGARTEEGAVTAVAVAAAGAEGMVARGWSVGMEGVEGVMAGARRAEILEVVEKEAGRVVVGKEAARLEEVEGGWEAMGWVEGGWETVGWVEGTLGVGTV